MRRIHPPQPHLVQSAPLADMPRRGEGTTMRLLPVAAAVLAAALSGCAAVGPDFERPKVTEPAAWRTTLPVPAQATAEPAAAAPVASADMANLAWWKAFGDPKLEALVQLALDNNKDLKIAAGRVREYAARLDIAKAQELPSVSARGSSNREKMSEERQVPLSNRTPVNSAAYELQAQVSWELDIWGRVRRTNEAYLADLTAIDENRRALTLTVVANVVASYVQLLALDQDLVLLKKELASRQETARLTESRQAKGGFSMLPVFQSRMVMEEAAAAIPPKEREIAATENALSILLGVEPSAVARARALNDLKAPPVPQGIPSQVLAQRPDVRMAEQNLIAANARIGVAKAEYFPVISLTGLFGYASTDLSKLLTAPASFGSAGTQVLAKLFDGGALDANVRQAEAVQALHVDAYRKAVQNAFFEVEDALLFYQKTRERADVLTRQLKAAQEGARYARKRYEGGMGTVFEALEAERQLTSAERLQVDVQRDTQLSLIQVYKAMGGGWKVAAPDILDSNAAVVSSSTN